MPPTRNRSRIAAATSKARQRRMLARLVAGCVSPLVLALAAQGSWTILSQRGAMVRGLEDKAAVVAKLMVNVVGPSVAMDDSSAVREGLAYMKADPSFAFALALAADGHEAGFAGSAGQTSAPPGYAKRLVSVTTLSRPAGMIVVSIPLESHGKQLGALHIGLKTDAVEADVTAKAWSAAIVSLAGILASIAVVLWLARTVARRANDIERLDGLVVHMRDVTGHVTRMARTVAETAGQVSRSADSIASGARTQSEATDETVSHLASLAEAVQSNARRAQDLAELARNSESTASAGEREAQEAARAVEEVREAAHRIDAITGTVADIALQTNILALNAAVEAARAGEHGRGFAVVAAEIGNLSHRSAESARAIKGLVEETKNVVANGAQLVSRSGSSLKAIASSTRSLTKIVHEIADACREQVNTLSGVNATVGRVASVTGSNTSETSLLVGWARGLVAQSTDLLRSTDQDGGAVARPASIAPARIENGVTRSAPPARSERGRVRAAG